MAFWRGLAFSARSAALSPQMMAFSSSRSARSNSSARKLSPIRITRIPGPGHARTRHHDPGEHQEHADDDHADAAPRCRAARGAPCAPAACAAAPGRPRRAPGPALWSSPLWCARSSAAIVTTTRPGAAPLPPRPARPGAVGARPVTADTGQLAATVSRLDTSIGAGLRRPRRHHDPGHASPDGARRLDGEQRVVDRAEAGAGRDHERQPEVDREVAHRVAGRERHQQAADALAHHEPARPPGRAPPAAPGSIAGPPAPPPSGATPRARRCRAPPRAAPARCAPRAARGRAAIRRAPRRGR